jgi:hypothetical protein
MMDHLLFGRRFLFAGDKELFKRSENRGFMDKAVSIPPYEQLMLLFS